MDVVVAAESELFDPLDWTLLVVASSRLVTIPDDYVVIIMLSSHRSKSIWTFIVLLRPLGDSICDTDSLM